MSKYIQDSPSYNLKMPHIIKSSAFRKERRKDKEERGKEEEEGKKKMMMYVAFVFCFKN